MGTSIRVATETDLSALMDFEDASGRAFTDLVMTVVGEDPPQSIETLREFQSDGRASVHRRGVEGSLLPAVRLPRPSGRPDHLGQRAIRMAG